MKKIIDHIIFGLLIFLLPVLSAAQAQSPTEIAHMDSLISLLDGMQDDSNKVQLLNRISFEYNSISPYDGISYGMQAMVLAEELEWVPGIARANSSLGANYFSLSDFPNAYTFWLKALALNEKSGNKNGVANHLHNIGLVFLSQKDYGKALDYFNRALKVSQEIGNKAFASNSYTAIGNIYMAQKNHAKALEYFFKALAMDKQGDRKKAISTDLLNIGEVYEGQGDHERALEMLYRGLEIKKSIVDRNGMSKAMGLIGKTLYNKYLQTADKNMLSSGISFLDSSIMIARNIGFLETVQNSSEVLAKAREASGEFKLSLKAYKQYYTIKDSIFSISRQNEIFNLEKRAELEEKEREMERLEEIKERKKYTQIAGISLFIIVLISSVILMTKSRIKPVYLDLLSTFSLIILFEFIQLLMHGTIEKITHHDLLLTYLCLLLLAAVVIPIHHKLEHWMKKKVSA